jgi:hypothetical protein
MFHSFFSIGLALIPLAFLTGFYGLPTCSKSRTLENKISDGLPSLKAISSLSHSMREFAAWHTFPIAFGYKSGFLSIFETLLMQFIET